MKVLSVIFSRHLIPPFASNPKMTQLLAQIFPVPTPTFPNILVKYNPIIPLVDSVVGFCTGQDDAKAVRFEKYIKPMITRKIF